MFTSQRTVMELLCDIYCTFYRTQALTDFLWLSTFAARGVGIDEAFKIASRARIKEDGPDGAEFNSPNRMLQTMVSSQTHQVILLQWLGNKSAATKGLPF